MKNYFEMSELVSTDCQEHNVIRGDFVFPNLLQLRIILNVIRHLVGCPIKVNSGYRNYLVNKAVGGVENSLHLQGRAADITCSRFSSLKSICKEFHQKGILEECVIHDNYIHVAI